MYKKGNCPYCRDSVEFLRSHRLGIRPPKYDIGSILRMRVGEEFHEVQVRGHKGRDPTDLRLTLYKVYDFVTKRFVKKGCRARP